MRDRNMNRDGLSQILLYSAVALAIIVNLLLIIFPEHTNTYKKGFKNGYAAAQLNALELDPNTVTP